MIQRLYRQARKLLRPVHPNRLRYYAKHTANRLGIRPAGRRSSTFLRLLVVGLAPRRLALTYRWIRDFRAGRRRRQREQRLTVGVDVSAFWEPLTGIGWYLYRLLEHCAERDDVRLRLYGPNLVDTPDLPRPAVVLPRGPALETVTYRVPQDLSLRYVWVVGWLRRRQARLIAADDNDVLFAPNYFLPPWFDLCRGRLVATVHDLSFQRVPWTMREQTRSDLADRLERTVAKAVWVLTDTETVLGELLESRLVNPQRVRAVHLGPGSFAATVPDGTATVPDGTVPDGTVPDATVPDATPERYALHVGTIEPRKNLSVLLAAWRLLRERGAEPPPLVLCGRLGWKTDELRGEIEKAGEEGWLHHFGYLENGQVAALYRRALLVALPSIYEGFGMPAVEAMSAAAPLVMSDIPVLREVGGDAALYVTPDEPEAWADTLEKVFADDVLRTDLATRGRERSRMFDWANTAQGTIEVWKKAAVS